MARSARAAREWLNKVAEPEGLCSQNLRRATITTRDDYQLMDVGKDDKIAWREPSIIFNKILITHELLVGMDINRHIVISC